MKSLIRILLFSFVALSFTPPSEINLMWGPIINFDQTNTAVCNKDMLELAIPDPMQIFVDHKEFKVQSAHIEMITSSGITINYEMHGGLVPVSFINDVKKYKGQSAMIYIENIDASTAETIPNFTIRMRSL